MKLYRNALGWLTERVTSFLPWERMACVYPMLMSKIYTMQVARTERFVGVGLGLTTAFSFIHLVSE